MPELVNLIDSETIFGYRSFELWQGDITQPGFPVDILVVSVNSGDYTPTRTSVVGALQRSHGIRLSRLSDDPEYDLRDVLRIWISKPISTYYTAEEMERIQHDDVPSCPIKRILCVELQLEMGIEALKDTIDNIFASLALFEAKGISAKTLALPLIGTGDIGLNPYMIMDALLPAAQRAIKRSICLERVAFFGYRSDDAKRLDAAMNNILGRSRVTLNQEPIVASLCDDLHTAIISTKHLVPEVHHLLLDEFQSVLRRDTIRSFEIGVLGRRLAEMIVVDIFRTLAEQSKSTSEAKKSTNSLARDIDSLKNEGIADWIISYLHVLRNLGNESAHEKHAGSRTPAYVGTTDLSIGLFCIQRLWEFWIDWKTQQRDAVLEENNEETTELHRRIF